VRVDTAENQILAEVRSENGAAEERSHWISEFYSAVDGPTRSIEFIRYCWKGTNGRHVDFKFGSNQGVSGHKSSTVPKVPYSPGPALCESGFDETLNNADGPNIGL
jgi:hypothetical protein